LGLPYLPDEPEFAFGPAISPRAIPIPSSPFPKSAYEKKNDAIVLSIVSAISHHETLTTKKKKATSISFRSRKWWPITPPKSGILTGKIAHESESTSTTCKNGDRFLHFPCPEGLEPDLSCQTDLRGFAKNEAQCPAAYQERVAYELGVIDKMGYADYFLIVQDYVNWAKTHGVSVGPGPWLGGGQLSQLVPQYRGARSDRKRFAFRALPQSGAPIDAGYRRRFQRHQPRSSRPAISKKNTAKKESATS
jgi:hypothetical protein